MRPGNKFPYKGYLILPQVCVQENGQFAACFSIHAGYDGSAGERYVRGLPTTEFASEDEAIAYILDFCAEWVDQNPI